MLKEATLLRNVLPAEMRWPLLGITRILGLFEAWLPSGLELRTDDFAKSGPKRRWLFQLRIARTREQHSVCSRTSQLVEKSILMLM
ncbi:hypothetical protein AD428_07635 [Achromobacter sp. DMS1]|nr:hypothetical protein AD428_07635 [Achromobacter sp. DMS1]